LTNNKS